MTYSEFLAVLAVLYAPRITSLVTGILARRGLRNRAQPDPWTVLVQELNIRLFQRHLHLGERRRAGTDLAGEGFHAANGPYRDRP